VDHRGISVRIGVIGKYAIRGTPVEWFASLSIDPILQPTQNVPISSLDPSLGFDII
jgi:hypothetical protein